ncbi:MAG: OsmC family protein [Chloroflexia bacterium]|nr:OsmC family protein [Chloroflexia bacterium]
MPEVEILWTQKLQFVGVDSSRHSVVMSAQDEENGTGAKPSDLLLLALGGCTAVDVVEILRKKRQQISGLKIRVSGEQDPDPPWTFRRIQVEYEVRGRDLSPKAVEQAVELAEEKYCSVRATLQGTVELTRKVRLLEE